MTTIAMCYVSPEGVVLGADSTTTYEYDDGPHYYNNAQKVFEVGENGTFGLATWGLGGLPEASYRTLVARLAQDLERQRPSTVAEVAERWAMHFGHAYRNSAIVRRFRELEAKPPLGALPAARPPVTRTAAEEHEFREISSSLTVGFYIGGYLLPDRKPEAYEIVFRPNLMEPVTSDLGLGPAFSGAPVMIHRLIYGIDPGTRQDILEAENTDGAKKWIGSEADLDYIIGRNILLHPVLPIREAIDFTHFCIDSTIKAFKFSTFPQICGGPVEIAVITTDRRFRWVRHKPLDAAITEGDRT